MYQHSPWFFVYRQPSCCSCTPAARCPRSSMTSFPIPKPKSRPSKMSKHTHLHCKWSCCGSPRLQGARSRCTEYRRTIHTPPSHLTRRLTSTRPRLTRGTRTLHNSSMSTPPQNELGARGRWQISCQNCNLKVGTQGGEPLRRTSGWMGKGWVVIAGGWVAPGWNGQGCARGTSK